MKKEELKESPSIMARAIKEFYTFEIDAEDNVTIQTIEFEHEAHNIYFNLNTMILLFEFCLAKNSAE